MYILLAKAIGEIEKETGLGDRRFASLFHYEMGKD